MSLRRTGAARASSPRRAVTVKDVAKRAGVSTATVSRVLSGQRGVTPELVERVRNAIEALNYHPNRTARSLRSQTTQIIGVLISDIQNPFFTSVVRGIEKVLEKADYTLILCNSDEDPAREQRLLATLYSEQVAGMIIAPTLSQPERYAAISQKGVPTVIIDRPIQRLPLDSVVVSNLQGAFLATRHLIDLGHTRIGFIGGPDRLGNARERKDGFLQTLKMAGIQTSEPFIQEGDFHQESGYKAMMRLLCLDHKPTAVLVANNLMTLGALQAIYEQGLSIPEDISIVGFDDMSWATSLRTPLTAVVQPTFNLGASAAELVLERIRNPNRPVCQVVLETQLNIRASTSGIYSPNDNGAREDNP